MFLPLVFALVTASQIAFPVDIPALAQRALGGDEGAVKQLRALGQPGLDALVKLRRELGSAPPVFAELPTPATAQWEALVDKVARQRYASQSGLFWHTDRAEALARARAEKKPVLSLRLLGDLDEDFSCANSRFFRTILYPDPVIAQALHDGWVLHWESVRKAPRIRIDLGDGKVIERTITGNSLHYVLTPDGDVVDVLPGLVGPTTFAAWLGESAAATRELAEKPSAQRRSAIAARMRQDLARRQNTWHAELKRVGVRVPKTLEAMSEATNDGVLDRLATDRDVRLSDEARAMVDWMMPAGRMARLAMPIAVTKSVVEAPMLRKLDPLAKNLARDEVQNQLAVKSQILAIALEGERELDDLTNAIYARAFLTPLDDPWMGLAPADVFTGLPPALEKPHAQ